jgi:hypothetical protein
MSNYKESDVVGVVWQRCHTVQISNQLNQDKTIFFQEEKVYNLDGDDMKKYVDGCGKQFSATQTFSLLNVNDGTETGAVMTHEQLYQAIYSLYIQTAKERDNQANQP